MMTPEEAARRAMACTATGALSGLPKWQWQPGMLEINRRPDGSWRCSARIGCDGLPTLRTPEPAFTDDTTVLALIPLVRRAWTGHRIEISIGVSDEADLWVYRPNACALTKYEAAWKAEGFPLYAALTFALEAAPEVGGVDPRNAGPGGAVGDGQ